MTDNKDFGLGIFNMDRINEVNNEKDFYKAKTMALETVHASKAKDANKIKATDMISSANTKTKLVIGMGNFSLAHQGMKVIR